MPMQSLASVGAVAAVILGSLAGPAAATDLPAAPAPVEIAVFAFELEEFSAGGGEEPRAADAEHLAAATEEAKRQLLQSGRYRVVETAGADPGPAGEHGLRNCGGCETALARGLGADQALVGVVTRISMTEYVVTLRLSDVRSGAVLASHSTGLRMGANYSWPRGVRWLMKNRVLASD